MLIEPRTVSKYHTSVWAGRRAGSQPMMVPWLWRGYALLSGKGGALSRSLPDAPRWSTELSPQAGGGVLSWLSTSGRNLMKNHGWDRWKGLRRYWGSNTVTGAVPAALGKPISRERSRSRWPKKTAFDNGSGWQEAVRQGWKQLVLVHPSSRLASQKPVDRPVSCGEGGGGGAASAGAELGTCWDTCCQSAQVQPLSHRACPRGLTETHSLELQASQLGTSIKNTKSIPPSVVHAHTPPPHTLTTEMLIQKGRWYPLSHTMLGSADSCFPFSYRGVLPTAPTTTSKHKQQQQQKRNNQKSAYFLKERDKQDTS